MIPSTTFTTLYVLNFNFKNLSNMSEPLHKYSYKNGFSLPDTESVANNDHFQRLSDMVLSSETVTYKLEDPKATSLSTQIDTMHIMNAVDPDSPKLVHWRDAVKFTRTWANTFQEETKAMAGVNTSSCQRHTNTPIHKHLLCITCIPNLYFTEVQTVRSRGGDLVVRAGRPLRPLPNAARQGAAVQSGGIVQ